MPTNKNTTTKPSKKERMAERARLAEVIRRRQMGLYTAEDTLDDLKRSLKDFYAKEDDAYLTLITRMGGFSVYTKQEFQAQLKEWKKLGVKCEDYNFHERELDGHKFFFFVAQPQDLNEAPMCPLAMVLGYMVSGFTYIVKDKATFEEVKAYLKA